MSYFRDINLEFETNNSGDIKTDENEDAIINSVQNILSTLMGSRRMLPTFADNLNSLLFDPIDDITASYIEDNILDAIERWDDRVEVTNINVIPKEDKNKYNIHMTINVNSIGEMVIEQDILKY